MRKKITFKEYDTLIERLRRLEVQPTDFAQEYDCAYFPSMKDVKENVNPEKDTEFILWLLECQEGLPMTEEQKEVRRFLNKIVYNQLKFVE